jgi:hypothetical protein
MKWVKTPQVKPDWYWFRTAAPGDYRDQALYVNIDGRVSEGRLTLDASLFDGEWQRIQPPED